MGPKSFSLLFPNNRPGRGIGVVLVSGPVDGLVVMEGDTLAIDTEELRKVDGDVHWGVIFPRRCI